MFKMEHEISLDFARIEISAAGEQDLKSLFIL
jgi:hypothetical protein